MLPETPPSPRPSIRNNNNNTDTDTNHPPRSPSPSENPDIARLRHTHTTHGYLAGITSAKSLHVQSGFDEGYPLGGRFGLKVGWILGSLQGLLRFRGSSSGDALREARRELAFEALFGERWFAPGGVWVYDVEGEGEEGVPTLDIVVEAHPVVRRWMGRVRALAADVGVVVEELGGASVGVKGGEVSVNQS